MDFLPVHWHEGMFLRPHHFQAAGRFLAHEMARGDKWDLHHNRGLRHIRHRPRRPGQPPLRRPLPPGPLPGRLPPLAARGRRLAHAIDLKAALERGHNPSVGILLALPAVHLGRANVGKERATTARTAPLLDARQA